MVKVSTPKPLSPQVSVLYSLARVLLPTLPQVPLSCNKCKTTFSVLFSLLNRDNQSHSYHLVTMRMSRNTQEQETDHSPWLTSLVAIPGQESCVWTSDWTSHRVMLCPDF